MPIVSVSLSETLLEELDAFVDAQEYSGRSEAFREGVRGLLAEETSRHEVGTRVTCIVAVLFEYGTGAEVALSTVRHEYESLLQTKVHSCTDSGCLECFVIEGPESDLDSFVASVRSIEGVERVERTVISTPPAAVVSQQHLASDTDE